MDRHLETVDILISRAIVELGEGRLIRAYETLKEARNYIQENV